MEELPGLGSDLPFLPVVERDHSKAEKTQDGPEQKQAHDCAALLLQRFQDSAENCCERKEDRVWCPKGQGYKVEDKGCHKQKRTLEGAQFKVIA